MVMRAITRAIGPIRRRIALTIGRAALTAAREENGLLLAQLTGLDGEVLDGVPVIQEYGFASRPLAGAQGVIACAGGNRRGAMVIATGDRRYRLSLAAGEVAIHDDLGQKVHLARGGILVKAPSITLDGNVSITGTLDVAGIVTAAAALTAATIGSAGNITAFTGATPIGLDAVKATYNTHTHNEKDLAPGPTGAPNEAI